MKFKLDLLKFSIIVLLLIGVANTALGAVFANRTAFETALISFHIEDFESYPTIGDEDRGALSNLTLNDFSLSSTPAAIKIWKSEHYGSHNTTLGGTAFLYLDTDLGFTGSETTFTFSTSINAFGFDYTGINEPGTRSEVILGEQIFNFTAKAPIASTSLFWGIIGIGDFTSVTLLTDLDSGFGVDEVTFASAVPLPATVWLFVSGLLLLFLKEFMNDIENCGKHI